MELKDNKRKKTFLEHMRALHRDIGFFVIGITIIYSLSGIVLVFRTTDFLKQNTLVQKTLSENMESDELARGLRVREVNIIKNEGNVVHFQVGKNIQDGKYNKATGSVTYTEKQLPALLNKFIELHKSSSRDIVHWFSVFYGMLLLFLAVSAFWMYKPGTKIFRRGIYISIAGFILATILLLV